MIVTRIKMVPIPNPPPQPQALPGPGPVTPPKFIAPMGPRSPPALRAPPIRTIDWDAVQQEYAQFQSRLLQAHRGLQSFPTSPTPMRVPLPQALPADGESRLQSPPPREQVPAEPSKAWYPAPLAPTPGSPAAAIPQVPTIPNSFPSLPPPPLSSRPLFTPRNCPPGFEPAQFEFQEALKELLVFSRNERFTWLHLAGLYLQHVWNPTLFPVAQRLWQRDVKKDDLLEKFPGAASIWPTPEVGTPLEAMVKALGESDFGRAVLQIAISRWSFAAPIREVEEVMNLASWKLPDLDPDVFTMGRLKTMAEGPEKQALLTQVEARSPRFFRKCMDDPLCGMYAIPTCSIINRCKTCRKLTSVIKHLASGSQSRPPLRHQNPRNGGLKSGRPADAKAGRKVAIEHMDQQRASRHQTSSSKSWKTR